MTVNKIKENPVQFITQRSSYFNTMTTRYFIKLLVHLFEGHCFSSSRQIKKFVTIGIGIEKNLSGRIGMLLNKCSLLNLTVVTDEDKRKVLFSVSSNRRKDVNKKLRLLVSKFLQRWRE